MIQFLVPFIGRVLLWGAVGGLAGAAIASIIDALNDHMWEGEVEEARAELRRLRNDQDADLEAIYREYRDRMSPEVRELFEEELRR